MLRTTNSAGFRGAKPRRTVMIPLSMSVLRRRLGVALDEVRFARRLPPEKRSCEDVVHECVDFRSNLSTGRRVIQLEHAPLQGGLSNDSSMKAPAPTGSTSTRYRPPSPPCIVRRAHATVQKIGNMRSTLVERRVPRSVSFASILACCLRSRRCLPDAAAVVWRTDFLGAARSLAKAGRGGASALLAP